MTQQQRITGLSTEELEAFFLLLPRIYSDYRDPRRGTFELAYIYANTPDNEASIFIKAAELANAGGTKALGTSEGALGLGYEGFDHSIQCLRAFGLKDGFPVVKFLVDVNEKGVRNVNTGSEAQKLAEYAKSLAGGGRNGGDIAVIAPPFHIVRAFMTTVTALKREGDIPVRVYAVPGVPLSWSQQIEYGQKLEKKPRYKSLDDDLQRLEKYRAPEFGGMLSARQVLNYLDWRDS